MKKQVKVTDLRIGGNGFIYACVRDPRNDDVLMESDLGNILNSINRINVSPSVEIVNKNSLLSAIGVLMTQQFKKAYP